MKRISLIAGISMLTSVVLAQTNTFPSSGNVGIGTLSPAEKLDVSGSVKVANSFMFGTLGLRDLSGIVTFDSGSNYPTGFNFQYGGSSNSAMYIGANGSIGIGTSIPSRIFTINSGASTSRVLLQTTSSGTSVADGSEFAQDTDGNTDLWNYENGFLRFGTNNTERFRITYDGKIGIGTTSPITGFHLSGTGAFPSIRLERTDANRKFDLGIGLGSSENTSFTIVDRTSGNNVLDINQYGNVGIGTTTPAEKLSVNGTIRSKEVKVETANWPDYVFDEGYKVGRLEELESYIKANKHLPGIPSAKEVEKEGISLGEMNAKLLQKIEELTLHVIQLKKDWTK